MADYGFNIGRKKPYKDEKEVRKILEDAGYDVTPEATAYGPRRGYWEYTIVSW